MATDTQKSAARTHTQLTKRPHQKYRSNGEPTLMLRRAAKAGGCPEVWVEVGYKGVKEPGRHEASRELYEQATNVHDRAEAISRIERIAGYGAFRQTWLELQSMGTDRYFGVVAHKGG
jgi:hypothetical protein